MSASLLSPPRLEPAKLSPETPLIKGAPARSRPAPATVLVTDGDERSSLAVARSLGSAGHRVLVCSGTGRSLSGASRFVEADLKVPLPLQEPGAFQESIRRALGEHGIDLLLPMTDAATEAVLTERAHLEGAALPLPPSAVYRKVSDKAWLLEAAERIGIRIPRQRVLRGPVQEAYVDELSFPLVVKPAISTRAKRAGVGMHYVSGPTALSQVVDAYPESAYPILVQERIVGTGVGVFLLLWEGELLAWFAHRRLREKPPSGGVSVYRESIRPDPSMLDRSVSLMRDLGWQGVCMLEYKVEEATGTPVLMEVNGRFWGSLQLAIDAGVDFPRLLLDAALGRAPRPVRSFRVGSRSRWFWGDVDHLLLRMKEGEEGRSLSRTTVEWLRGFARLATMRPGRDRSEVFRWTDPAPFFRESARWIRHVATGGR